MILTSFPKSYCVFDFETTDLDVTKAEVVEIGAKKSIWMPEGDGGRGIRVSETRTWLINIGRDLPEITTKITGITTEEMKRDGRKRDDCFLEFREFSRGLNFVGHNILRYDIPVLKNPMNGFFNFSYQCQWPVDTAGLYKALVLREPQRWYETHEEHMRRVLEIRSTTKFNLMHACTQLGIKTDVAAHRAGGDVELADRLYRKLTEIV